MLFRQLFDPPTSTFTYLLADEKTREAILIDSVFEQIDRDRQLIEELGLNLRYLLDTHIHADHVTGAGELRQLLGAKSVVSKAADVDCADILVEEGDKLRFGAFEVEVLQTPGHTDTCLTFVVRDGDKVYAFTGDALFVRGCGRTDFQAGDSSKLFQSVRGKIFALPDHANIFPAHDYHGFNQTTVWEEKKYNPRLNLSVNEAAFIETMANLKLANPKQIDIAVPANLKCGKKAAAVQMV